MPHFVKKIDICLQQVFYNFDLVPPKSHFRLEYFIIPEIGKLCWVKLSHFQMFPDSSKSTSPLELIEFTFTSVRSKSFVKPPFSLFLLPFDQVAFKGVFFLQRDLSL